jgi:hypothetical protein
MNCGRRRAILLAAALASMAHALLPPAALAGPCTDDIAKFEQEIQQEIQSDPGTGPSGPQSLGAQLHHQPTPASVSGAERQARTGFKDALARAERFDALGQRDKCMAALEEAKLIYFE